MTKTVIAGAGGFGIEVAGIMKALSNYEVVGFLDNNPEKKGVIIGNLPVLGDDSKLQDLTTLGVSAIVVAVGAGNVRQQLSQRALEHGYTLPAIIHPKAYVASDVIIGTGVIIYPNATIMPGCHLHDGVLINAGAVLGHEVIVGQYSNINTASIAGRVSIGEQVLIGIGSTVLENRSIGDGATIGAGAVVTRDISPRVTVVGIPATPLQSGNSR